VAPEANAGAQEAIIDRALQAWRQGDCTLEPQWFVHRINPSLTLTTAGSAAAREGAELAEQQVNGLVVVSQTCDIVRACQERPYLEVCPLVRVSYEALHQIERGRKPAYAYLPQLADRHLVADLDRTMTVEKALVLCWSRTPGCASDTEVRAFAQALARKRARFAFPDDFNLWARKLQGRLVDKHDRDSPEGRALRALREIRVQASPYWESGATTIMFFFIRHDDDSDFEGAAWQDFLDAWLKLLPANTRFTAHGQISTLDELTASDYVYSDALDLDHLSLPD
jgi:hypothetical protein